MSYRHLRALMKRISPPEDHTLKNCDLIIDGRSFFKTSYKKSECQSILGGEYDRYADYLKSILKPFKECNITCYVIFNGGMEADLERRTELHKEVLNHANNINPEDRNAYCEPIFAKDVWKEVLEELEIKYYVTEHDSWKVIFWVANVFHCPILTNNYEYSLRYMDCISPKSLVYLTGSDGITCKIFKSDSVRNSFRVKHTVMPLFYTLLDESSTYYKKLFVIVDCLKPKDILPKVLRWTRWQAYDLENTLKRIQELLSEEECEDFFKAYHGKKDLCKKERYNTAVKHFRQRGNKNGNDKVPIPYINLICNGIFSGSWVVYDKDQQDAILAALDIIFYACRTLTYTREDKLIFIGRQNDETCVWEIETPQPKTFLKHPDPFKNFIFETMPGFDFEILKTVPEECWILIVTLVCYLRNKIDLNFAYSMILSYVFMGPVSENTGLIKRSKFISPETVENDQEDRNGLKNKECVAVIDSLMDLFYVMKLKQCFDRKILHTFAEFQHCLQHMNYLNKLCGQNIKTTVFHKTINATFAYNIYLKLKDKSDAHKYLEKRLKSSSVFVFYARIKNVFDACLLSIGKLDETK